jgi:hypothetical protein
VISSRERALASSDLARIASASARYLASSISSAPAGGRAAMSTVPVCACLKNLT